MYSRRSSNMRARQSTKVHARRSTNFRHVYEDLKTDWHHVISDVENKERETTRQMFIKDLDFSVTIPKDLRNRVGQILTYKYDDYDEKAFIFDSDAESAATFEEDILNLDETYASKKDREKEKKKGVFNESTCSIVERLEAEYQKFDLKVDTPLIETGDKKGNTNWTAQFVCKARKERVTWPTKIYNLEERKEEKTLDEQAEQLMDAAAERFCEWMNSLGSSKATDMSKEVLKSLFSIEVDRTLLSSIITEPKEVNAIAQTVADKWNLPDMAIERRYELYVENRIKNLPKQMVPTVVFGNTVPMAKRSWKPAERDMPVSPAFPDEVLSGQYIFKDIGHLRAVKNVVHFLRHNENFMKPEYFSKHGWFERTEKVQKRTDKPLYEKLRLKY